MFEVENFDLEKPQASRPHSQRVSQNNSLKFQEIFYSLRRKSSKLDLWEMIFRSFAKTIPLFFFLIDNYFPVAVFVSTDTLDKSGILQFQKCSCYGCTRFSDLYGNLFF